MEKRFFYLKEAANYLGVSVNTFKKCCPVKPVALGESDAVLRYDRRDLDAWADYKKGALINAESQYQLRKNAFDE